MQSYAIGRSALYKVLRALSILPSFQRWIMGRTFLNLSVQTDSNLPASFMNSPIVSICTSFSFCCPSPINVDKFITEECSRASGSSVISRFRLLFFSKVQCSLYSSTFCRQPRSFANISSFSCFILSSYSYSLSSLSRCSFSFRYFSARSFSFFNRCRYFFSSYSCFFYSSFFKRYCSIFY